LVENVSRTTVVGFSVGCITRHEEVSHLERSDVMTFPNSSIEQGKAFISSVYSYSAARDACAVQKQVVGINEVVFPDGGKWCLGSCSNKNADHR
jgi:hypothetical protein